MEFLFTEENIKNELNKVELEDMLFYGESLSGVGKNYIITGSATIDGEKYNNFQIEFELAEEPKENTLEEIMNTDWDWFDYVF